MSGDVQPRKRKDKKKKRESLDVRKSEGELIFSRKSSLQDDESSHGVHITKMGTDDVHLHVHQEHDTGGHWCAKIIFFSLMAILMGLVCLIILENRGIQDADTPLSESRFSNYFNGWVDEHRVEHDDHHDSSPGSLEHDDEHEHDDEPFEEEADHSEGEDEVADEEDENVTPEDVNEDENITGENITAEEVDEDEEDEDNVTVEEENATAEEEDDKNVTLEDENVTAEQNDEADDDEDDYKTNEEHDNTISKETTKSNSKGVHDDEDDAFDEDDDDGNFDSLEKIVDNDAAEIELLKEKARQQAAADSKQNAASAENDIDDEADNAPSWASSLAVKIGVGLALALVARLVLLRKNPISNEEPTPEILMKRRLTIASPNEEFPEEAGDVDEPLPEDDYSEEEIEIEEEIEYIDEDEEPVGEENQVDAEIKPKTAGGGPQSLEDDEIDLFEQELRRANDEMMQEFNYH